MAGPNGTRVAIYGTAAGTTFINTIYTQHEVEEGNWPALAAKADQDWVRKVNVYQGQIVNWHTVVINHVATGGPSTQSFAINRPGAVAGLLPMQVALVVRVQTGLAGRSFNGRWFLSGLGTSINNNGMPSSSTLSGWPTQAAAILAAWTVDNPLGGRLCLYTRKLEDLIPITNLSMSVVFGTVRSRKFGRGI